MTVYSLAVQSKAEPPTGVDVLKTWNAVPMSEPMIARGPLLFGSAAGFQLSGCSLTTLIPAATLFHADGVFGVGGTGEPVGETGSSPTWVARRSSAWPVRGSSMRREPQVPRPPFGPVDGFSVK